jgi:hypothetical protein
VGAKRDRDRQTYRAQTKLFSRASTQGDRGLADGVKLTARTSTWPPLRVG